MVFNTQRAVVRSGQSIDITRYEESSLVIPSYQAGSSSAFGKTNGMPVVSARRSYNSLVTLKSEKWSRTRPIRLLLSKKKREGLGDRLILHVYGTTAKEPDPEESEV